MKHSTRATKANTPKEPTFKLAPPRKIQVMPGDVFDSEHALVVVGVNNTVLEWAAPNADMMKRCGEQHVLLRNAWTGRVTRVRIELLQRDYGRLGEADTKTAHRFLANTIGVKFEKPRSKLTAKATEKKTSRAT